MFHETLMFACVLVSNSSKAFIVVMSKQYYIRITPFLSDVQISTDRCVKRIAHEHLVVFKVI
jgi:hypothetical protein